MNSREKALVSNWKKSGGLSYYHIGKLLFRLRGGHVFRKKKKISENTVVEKVIVKKVSFLTKIWNWLKSLFKKESI